MPSLELLFRRVLDLAPEEFYPEMGRQDTDKWDSLGHLLLVSEIEREYGIKLTMAEVEATKTYRDLALLVTSKHGRA